MAHLTCECEFNPIACCSEDTDKVYFRKKDEISNYAEFAFKAKILLTKK